MGLRFSEFSVPQNFSNTSGMLYTLGLNDPLILIDILSFEDHMEDFFQISKVSRSFFFF